MIIVSIQKNISFNSNKKIIVVSIPAGNNYDRLCDKTHYINITIQVIINWRLL